MESLLIPAVWTLFILEIALFVGISLREVGHYRKRTKEEQHKNDESKASK